MSRYFQLYDTTSTAKFQTLMVGAASIKTTAISGRRITLFTGTVPTFVEFGTSTVTATTSSAVAPANCMIDYHFEPGQFVALLSSGAVTYVTVLDAD